MGKRSVQIDLSDIEIHDKDDVCQHLEDISDNLSDLGTTLEEEDSPDRADILDQLNTAISDLIKIREWVETELG